MIEQNCSKSSARGKQRVYRGLRPGIFMKMHRVSFLRTILQRSSLLSSSAYIQKERDLIAVTDKCVQKLKQVAEDGEFLRVMVDGGGCSGFQYNFTMDHSVKEDDKVFEKDGVKVVVDSISMDFLQGSTIDYEEELIRSAFRVTSNPQASQGCSCGVSFSLK